MFSAPAPPSICWNSVTTSTQEKKCGRYTTAWITDLILLLRMEFSRIASAIGTGKYSTSCTALITSVFWNACQNNGSPSSASKLARPTHWLPVNPV
jgi:hypothetical protein